jgi:hypothetical protein
MIAFGRKWLNSNRGPLDKVKGDAAFTIRIVVELWGRNKYRLLLMGLLEELKV